MVAASDMAHFATSSCYSLAASGGAQTMEMGELAKVCQQLIVTRERSDSVDQELDWVLRSTKDESYSAVAADSHCEVAAGAAPAELMMALTRAMGDAHFAGTDARAAGVPAAAVVAARRHHSFGIVHYWESKCSVVDLQAHPVQC